MEADAGREESFSAVRHGHGTGIQSLKGYPNIVPGPSVFLVAPSLSPLPPLIIPLSSLLSLPLLFSPEDPVSLPAAPYLTRQAH